ncbi:MAG: hypothetical protein HPY65_11050 [Syntrophaceae bacterium]|nr:hypothetical protein [Syntrophaceae bacterium]
MSAEARRDTGSSASFAPFFGGAGLEQAKAWEESLTGFYRGLSDAWSASTKNIALPQAGITEGWEDMLLLSRAVWKEPFSGLATVQDRMEAFANLARVQQQSGQDLYRSFADCLRRVSAARQSGGLEKAIQVCLESHGELIDEMESSCRDQVKAFFDVYRSLIPRENRTGKVRKEKAS